MKNATPQLRNENAMATIAHTALRLLVGHGAIDRFFGWGNITASVKNTPQHVPGYLLRMTTHASMRLFVLAVWPLLYFLLIPSVESPLVPVAFASRRVASSLWDIQSPTSHSSGAFAQRTR